MAHNPKFSEEFVDAKADAGLALLTNGYIRIYNDPKPAHADDAITSQTLLAELRWNAVAAFQAAAGGVAVANAITKDDSANAEGTATWFRALKADGEIDMGRVKARASCSVIVNLVEVAYPQRMRTKDGEDYDVWLEAMDEIDQGAGYVVSVTVGDIEWLLGHLKNDGLGIPPGMVQWRVKLRQYAEGLVKDADVKD
jgi:hypothetical protein